MRRTDIKIIVADDHTLFRAGLVRMLNSFPGVRVVAEAASGAETLRTIEKVEANVLLLDLSMPDVSGVSLIEDVRRAMPELPIQLRRATPLDALLCNCAAGAIKISGPEF